MSSVLSRSAAGCHSSVGAQLAASGDTCSTTVSVAYLRLSFTAPAVTSAIILFPLISSHTCTVRTDPKGSVRVNSAPRPGEASVTTSHTDSPKRIPALARILLP